MATCNLDFNVERRNRCILRLSEGEVTPGKNINFLRRRTTEGAHGTSVTWSINRSINQLINESKRADTIYTDKDYNWSNLINFKRTVERFRQNCLKHFKYYYEDQLYNAHIGTTANVPNL